MQLSSPKSLRDSPNTPGPAFETSAYRGDRAGWDRYKFERGNGEVTLIRTGYYGRTGNRRGRSTGSLSHWTAVGRGCLWHYQPAGHPVSSFFLSSRAIGHWSDAQLLHHRQITANHCQQLAPGGCTRARNVGSDHYYRPGVTAIRKTRTWNGFTWHAAGRCGRNDRHERFAGG